MSAEEATEDTAISPLQYLQVICDQAGLGTYLLQPNELEGHPYQQLMLTSDPDEQGRSYILRLSFLNDIVSTGFQAADFPLEMEAPWFLQFVMALPVGIQEEQIMEMARLTAVISRYLPNGAFGVNETDGIYFRDCLATVSQEVDPELVVQLVIEVFFLAKRFIEPIDALLAREKSLPELIAELEGAYGR